MPGTINGVGTHYWSKRNSFVRAGTCGSCRRDVELCSYDTILFFVVLFIPILPLGRRRVLDMCPRCSRHQQMSLSRWNQEVQRALQEGTAGMRVRPGDPEPALELHGKLLELRAGQQAEELRDALVTHFAAQAQVLAALAEQLGEEGAHDLAQPLIERVCELDPELPAARVRAGLLAIEQGDLVRARERLSFLQDRHCGLSPLPLWPLAEALSDAGEHRDALELYAEVIRREERLAYRKDFRRDVVLAQKRAGGYGLRLPPLPRAWGRIGLYTAATLVLLALLGAVLPAVANEPHRVWIVSDLAAPTDVSIDGQRPLKLRGRQAIPIELAPGPHLAVVDGARPVPFELKQGFWSRLGGNPTYVLDVGGSAALLRIEVPYSQSPRSHREPRWEVLYGEELLELEGLRFAFAPPPEQWPASNSKDVEWVAGLELFQGSHAEMFRALLDARGPSSALAYGEWSLRLRPDDNALLEAYCAATAEDPLRARALTFLRRESRALPVRLPLNRALAELELLAGHDVLARYTVRLEANPTDSALLALRGFLCASASEAEPYFRAALAREPGLAWAQHALASLHAARGEWPAAVEAARSAHDADPTEIAFRRTLFLARSGAGDLAALADELRRLLRAEPLDVWARCELLEVTSALGEDGELQRILDEGERALGRRLGRDAADGIALLRQRAAYVRGDLERCLALEPKDSPGMVRLLLEMGRVDGAAEFGQPELTPADRPWSALVWALASDVSGARAAANVHLERAHRRFLETNRPEHRACADLLSRKEAPSEAELEDLHVGVQDKALLLAVLARRHPERFEELARRARSLNVLRVHPHHLISRATSPAR